MVRASWNRASALEMYRKRFGRILPTDVADFLILDREFPRAIHFCLIKSEESLLAITGGERGRFRTPAEKRWAAYDRNWITRRLRRSSTAGSTNSSTRFKSS